MLLLDNDILANEKSGIRTGSSTVKANHKLLEEIINVLNK